MIRRFLVAGSRRWNRLAFDEQTKELPGDWHFVSTPTELSNSMANVYEYIFFIHWNWIVPRHTWETHECVCFHMTDLPYGRGGSPLQNLILSGKKETKLTALRMTEAIDAGPIYAKREMPLFGKAADIYLRAEKLSWDIIRWMIDNRPTPTPQLGIPTTFVRRQPKQSEIPKDCTLEHLYDFIRMLDAPGYPAAFIKYGNFLLEFSDVSKNGDDMTARVHIKQGVSDHVSQ
jgi:methionyl-tRNA formyltransferase